MMTEEIIEQPVEQKTLAMVKGEALFELPRDLYIPPEALEIFLEAFEGPLDLLLYLIKKQNMDILDIPVAKITDQYMRYIDLMLGAKWELIAEYLLMAAMLAEIKSRMLLPRSEEVEGEEDDPRAELVRRLQEYERYKEAAEDIAALPRVDRDVFPVCVTPPDIKVEQPPPDVDLSELLAAFREVLNRVKLNASHHVMQEVLSIRERMSEVLTRVKADHFTDFVKLFDVKEGRLGVVVTMIAILELIRQSMIEIVQAESYAPIHVKAIG